MQVTAEGHIGGNIAVGSGKDVLIGVVTQLTPHMGYLRSLNALRGIDKLLPEPGKNEEAPARRE